MCATTVARFTSRTSRSRTPGKIFARSHPYLLKDVNIRGCINYYAILDFGSALGLLGTTI